VAKHPPSAEGTKQSQLLPRLNFRLESNMAVVLSDGNAFAIMAVGRRELERTNRHDEVTAFIEEMTSGDYDHLLRTMFKWFPDAELAS
jgi:hypothetical protein